jgi:hypothetical protein
MTIERKPIPTKREIIDRGQGAGSENAKMRKELRKIDWGFPREEEMFDFISHERDLQKGPRTPIEKLRAIRVGGKNHLKRKQNRV